MQILGCGNVKKLIFTGFFLKNRLKKQIRGALGERLGWKSGRCYRPIRNKRLILFPVP